MNLPALHVVDRGQGAPTVVFLHYFAGSSASWSGVIDRLSLRCRCLAPDLPGFGRSPHDERLLSVGAYVDRVERLIAERAATPYVLAGHSMGGKIAALLASRRPRGLRGLILLAPSPLTPEPMAEEERTELLRSRGDPGAAQTLLEKIAVRPLTGPARAAVLRDNLATAPGAWRWWLEAGSREDLGPVGLLGIPILVAAGTDDQALPLPIHRATAARLGAADPVEAIADCGHLLPLEAPDEVARSISRFIDRLESTPPTPPARRAELAG